MDIKKLIKSLLFIFVVLSLGVLVYKEFSPKSESNATGITATKVDTVAVSGESVPAFRSCSLLSSSQQGQDISITSITGLQKSSFIQKRQRE